jgi:FkbH-like protein
MSNEYLHHPLDVKNIILSRDQIKKNILSSRFDFLDKKIAVLGGSTTSELIHFLDIFLLSAGIKGTFYESDYGQYMEEAIFDNKNLTKFSPDIIYIHTTAKNIDKFPCFNFSSEDTENLILEEIKKYTSIWESLDHLGSVIIQNNFESPQYRTLGNLDAVDHRGKVSFTNQLNTKLLDEMESYKNVYLNDISYISSAIGLNLWYDNRLWHSYKYAVSFQGLVFLAQNIKNIISAVFGKSKKNLVLDLDNTLWGGVIGDDGLEGIKIGEDGSIGESFKEFQTELKRLRDSGILLSISSKNEIENAHLGLSHPEGILKKEDFASIKANWEPKDTNIHKMGDEINLGLDSFVFLDDNPAERLLVRENLIDVSVPEIGSNPNDYFKYIDEEGYFERVTLAEDDIDRSRYYSENQKRSTAETKFKSQGDFLESLNMEAKIFLFDDIGLERISQLINKTNQFNFTTKRYSIKEVTQIKDTNDCYAFYGRLADKFGDNGLISVLIARKDNTSLIIDSWLMSCRVLKRGMEFAMFNFLLDFAEQENIQSIIGIYIPTAKNKMVENLYKEMGFKLVSQSEESHNYELKLGNRNPRIEHHIKIIN